ncbi:MAG TPA: PilN domain-containing protein [Verrucomicrobiae bacterium]|jgi:type IV pilus assembly protein PilN|nr:PilN domain-containing protein [Verrucomicrobiae bacterium]
MIRINLLGTPRARRGGGGRRQAAVDMPSGEGPNSLVLGLIVVVALGAAMYISWSYYKNKSAALDKEMSVQLKENQRLSVVKAKYEESKRKKELFERRVRVIDQLKEQQHGPVDILNTVADTINSTDAVWLESMTNDGKSIDFLGTALSPNAVADLMVNLRKTGAFKTVEIRETAQDPATKDIQTFKFELVCELSGKTEKKTT